MFYEIEVIKSKRKTITLEVVSSKKLVLRVPLGTSEKMLIKIKNEVLSKKEKWIEEQIKKATKREENRYSFSDKDIEHMKKKAEPIISSLVEKYSKIMNVTYNRVRIKNQKTRWGSSSEKGNLNFNCKLILMPEDILEYVVVHELAHQKQMNHSKLFWAEVEKVLPDYKKSADWLRENGRRYM